MWWKEYERTGKVPEREPRTPAFSDGQMQPAVSYYLEHRRSLSRTRRAMGYPKSNATLAKWIDELAQKILATDKPLFTTCHSTQLLNVALGGTFCMDVPSRTPRPGMQLWRHTEL